MKNSIGLFVVLLFFVVPVNLSAQEPEKTFYQQFSDVLYDECWCGDSLIIVPDTGVHVENRIYEEVVSFWNSLGLGVTFVFSHNYKPEQNDYVVLVQRFEGYPWQEEACKRGLCTLAQFHEGIDRRKNENYGGWCFLGAFLWILDRFYNGSYEEQLEAFTHELGHALGLDDGIDGTLMQGIDQDGFFLNERQLEALKAVYPKK